MYTHVVFLIHKKRSLAKNIFYESSNKIKSISRNVSAFACVWPVIFNTFLTYTYSNVEDAALANRWQLVTELFQHTRTPAHTHKLIFHEHAPSGHAKLSTCIKSHKCVRINLLTLFVIIRCILLLYIYINKYKNTHLVVVGI